jgi:transcriptional regulatory protein RtcR
MRVTFNKEARDAYLRFAEDPAALWRGNFRDLAASVTRMATLSPAGRIDAGTVAFEAARLRSLWTGERGGGDILDALLAQENLARIDPFDRVQLAYTIDVCRRSGSLSAAGRALFAASRALRTSTNDADRLRKYLARFDLDWAGITAP